MAFLADVCLPILLSAVSVFVASSLLHMVIPLHRGVYSGLPDESGVMEALRRHGVKPGTHMFPRAESMKDRESSETNAKFEQGPVGRMTGTPSGIPSLGENLVQWFALTVVISAICAYVASFALAPGAEYLRVFRLTGTVAVLAYATGTPVARRPRSSADP